MKSLKPEPTRRGRGAAATRRARARHTLALVSLALLTAFALVSPSSASRTTHRGNPEGISTSPQRILQTSVGAAAHGGPRLSRAGAGGAFAAGAPAAAPLVAPPLLRPQDPTPTPTPAPALPAETVETFAADCTTPKTDFLLGETVCARVTNAFVGLNEDNQTVPLTRFSWINPSGFQADPTGPADPRISAPTQTNSFTLASTAAGNFGDRRGKWRVSIVNIFDPSQRTFAEFTVRDPQRAAVDLSVAATLEQSQTGLPAGAQAPFLLFVENKGPDTASGVQLRVPVPNHTTFFSLAPAAGSPFTCVNPNVGAGPGGTSVCTAASLAPGVTTIFTAVYLVGSTVAVGTEIIGEAEITGDLTNGTPETDDDVTERHEPDNFTSAAYRVSSTPTCTINTPSDVVVDAGPGQSGVLVDYGEVTGTGNCGVITCDFASNTVFPLGTTFVTCSNANLDVVERFSVTVNDTQTPVATCPADFTVLESAPGSGSALVNFPAPTVVDNDPNVAVTFDPPSGSLLEIGTHQVTATAADVSGNTASCSFEVTVNPRPGACTITPDVATLPTVTGQCAVSVSTIPTATDSCSGQVGATTSDPRSFDEPGTYTINWTYTSLDGTTVSQPQTVIVAPGSGALGITGPPAVNVPITQGSPACSVEIDDLGAVLNTSVTGSCDDLDITRAVTPAAPDNVFLAGVSYTVVTTVTNGSSTASITQTLRVVDGLNPTVTAPADAAFSCAGDVPAASPSQATAADNCGTPTVTVSETNNGGAGSAASPLVITRTFTATDGSGRTASDAQVITVIDTTAPVISCPADITVYLPLNSPAVSMPVSFPAPAATDNCGGTPTVTTSHASGAVFPAGTTTVTATANDGRGNTSSCTFNVTVLYNFTGFFAPVDNPPTLNQVNAGRAIPVKFSLSGDKGLGIFAIDFPASQQVSCSSTAPVSDLEETLTAGGSSLSYDASSDRYNYVWKTDSSWKNTCRQLVIKLNDGSTYTALFKFK